MLDKKLCDRLCRSASLIIGRHVLITDKDGIVVGSDDPTRIGTLHAASLPVMEQGRQMYHSKASADQLFGTRPGTTIPLSIEGEVIGSIGITGSPEDISKYAELIHQIAQTFIEFSLQQRSSADRDYKLRNLLHDIAGGVQEGAVENIRQRAFDLGYDLELPRVVILLEATPAATEDRQAFAQKYLAPLLNEVFCLPQDIVCQYSDTEVAVLTYVAQGGTVATEKVRRIMDALEMGCEQLHIGVGGPAVGAKALHGAYGDALLALRTLRVRGVEKGHLTVQDISLEKLALQIDRGLCGEVQEHLLPGAPHLLSDSQIVQLVECWCRSLFNFAETARQLHVHKSTLTYRFQKIREQYALDLYSHDTATALYLLILHQKLTAEEDRFPKQ